MLFNCQYSATLRAFSYCFGNVFKLVFVTFD